MNVHNLFPLPVGFARLGRDLTKTELEFILGQDKYANQGNTTSSDRMILKSKELTDIREFIEDAMVDYFKTVHDPKGDVALYVTQSWANYTDPGQHHHKHAHPNSFISGVFYPQADREVDKIHFYKTGYERIKVQPATWNLWNSESWWFEVGAGDLILFPSHLEHMVETKVGNETRVSIAFNTFLKGHIGVDENLTGLQLGED
jgi:uncharacterized protein (TIGR02466 family)